MAQIATFTGFRPCSAPRAAAAAARPVQQRSQLCVRASQVAAPASLEVKTLDGTAAGSASIALRVADESSAKGLVHRYLVMVRQNARQVRQCVGRAAAARSRGGWRQQRRRRSWDSQPHPCLPVASGSVAGQRKHPHPR
jgi:large subunit ribosomal protein L4